MLFFGLFCVGLGSFTLVFVFYLFGQVRLIQVCAFDSGSGVGCFAFGCLLFLLFTCWF